MPRNRGTVTPIIGALCLRGGLVVMDDARAHRHPRVAEVLARAGATLVDLPPYSADADPIELAWSNLKDFLRAAKARTVDELTNCVGPGMTLVDTRTARRLYQTCGYNAHVS